MEQQENQITPFSTVRPLVDPKEARRQWDEFEALKTALLTQDDYQKISGNRYIKKSGFRKIAVYFGLSDTIQYEEKVEREDDSFYWRIKVQVEAPNGRTSVGVGICDSTERRYAHLEHDVYATAHTRAKNRAISDMVAGGVVSAEEVETHSPSNVKQTERSSAQLKRKKVEGKVNKPGERQKQKTPKTPEKESENLDQIKDKYEDNITMTLVANGLKVADYLEIQQYGKNVYVAPPKNIEEEVWVNYNSILANIGADWDQELHRWEIPVKQ